MISVSIVLFHNKYEEIFFLINSILDSVNVNINNIYLLGEINDLKKLLDIAENVKRY